MANTHPSDDTIERFALNNLPDSQLAEFEEHLLICPRCQQRVARTDEFISQFRAAARRVEDDSTPLQTPRFRLPKVVWAATAAALLLLIYFTLPHASSPAQVIALTAMRGDTTPVAKAGTPVHLLLDGNGLSEDFYRVEVVDSSGTRAAERVGKRSNTSIIAEFDGLAAGQYWIRVYDRSILAREYSLVVK
jgi:hypothetical protein